MKKLIGVTVAVVVLLLPVMAIAAPDSPHLNWGPEVNAGQSPGGKPVINITHKVTNDLDSKVGGGFWARSNYNRHIQVWRLDQDTFLAVVKYQGSFTTLAGDSPQGNDPDGIAAGIRGTMQGGYRMTITGTLNPHPEYRTKGNVGSFDYKDRADVWNWIGAYFEGDWPTDWNYTYEWWGWVYRAGKNGTWVNASTGNEGDITDG